MSAYTLVYLIEIDAKPKSFLYMRKQNFFLFAEERDIGAFWFGAQGQLERKSVVLKSTWHYCEDYIALQIEHIRYFDLIVFLLNKYTAAIYLFICS